MINAKEEELKYIVDTINKYISNCEIRVFGSRIKGNSKKYSDIDLAIVTEKKIEWCIIGKIKDEFAESELPYRVDVLDWNGIDENFRKIIDKKYIIIQKREKTSYK
ncbi:MAG: nucleotidyltransferase domain-containing protein [Fusobacteria bacterium]|nr:nucleotidyltransferase domain-containing protein [Fusobacteriota bacterium]